MYKYVQGRSIVSSLIKSESYGQNFQFEISFHGTLHHRKIHISRVHKLTRFNTQRILLLSSHSSSLHPQGSQSCCPRDAYNRSASPLKETTHQSVRRKPVIKDNRGGGHTTGSLAFITSLRSCPIFFSFFLFPYYPYPSQLRNLLCTLNVHQPLVTVSFSHPTAVTLVSIEQVDSIYPVNTEESRAITFEYCSRKAIPIDTIPFLQFGVFTRVVEFCQYHTLSAKQIDRLAAPRRLFSPIFAWLSRLTDPLGRPVDRTKRRNKDGYRILQA